MQILKFPHPTLRHKSKPLCRVDAELRSMIREMFDLMYANQGIGLAANQVDLPYRLVVINLESDPAATDEEHVFINPVITQRKGMEERDEGCLSLPDLYAPVKRPQKITVNAYNLKGEEIHWELDGLFARAVQHECDHLDGILFIDRVSESQLLGLKRDLEDLETRFHGERERGLILEDAQIRSRLIELESART